MIKGISGAARTLITRSRTSGWRRRRAIVNRMAGGKRCDLLDVGCGPATLGRLVDENISYHGIDIAIHEPAPNLLEADFLETPISFHGRKFDIVVAQGIFEYVGTFLAAKFGEIASCSSTAGSSSPPTSTFTIGSRDLRPVQQRPAAPGLPRQPSLPISHPPLLRDLAQLEAQ